MVFVVLLVLALEGLVFLVFYVWEMWFWLFIGLQWLVVVLPFTHLKILSEE